MELKMSDSIPEVCPGCQATRLTDTFKVRYKCETWWAHVIPMPMDLEYPQHLQLCRSDECFDSQISKYRTASYLLRDTLRDVVANLRAKRQEGGDIDLEDYKEAQELLQILEANNTLGRTPTVGPLLADPSGWHPATERAETGRVVWIIECHPKKIYPQSYSIHAGTVEVPQDPSEWRVSQGDEAGSGWASWYPAVDGSTKDEQFIAWAYVEDFSPALDLLSNF